jgi:hypothetical protein
LSLWQWRQLRRLEQRGDQSRGRKGVKAGGLWKKEEEGSRGNSRRIEGGKQERKERSECKRKRKMEGEAPLEGWSECRDGDLGRNAGVWLVRKGVRCSRAYLEKQGSQAQVTCR